jgi:phosphatidate phosphatase APP1
MFLDTKMHKINHLRYFIFNSLRLLVLVGDSGEHDPEIYGSIARKYPRRIHRIFIRAVRGESNDDQRFARAFEGIDADKWLVFTDAVDLHLVTLLGTSTTTTTTTTNAITG